MHFLKFTLLASAGLVAANAVENVNRDVNQLAAAPAITPAPEVRRDIIDDFASSVEALGDDIQSKAETWISKGKDVYSDVKGDVSTRIDGVETWISTKAAAASSAFESAKAEASDAANDDKDNAAGAVGVGSMAGVVLGAVAAGAYLVL